MRKTRAQFPAAEYFPFALIVGSQRLICIGMRAEAQRAVLQLLCVLTGPFHKQRKLQVNADLRPVPTGAPSTQKQDDPIMPCLFMPSYKK
jgi:hypothetical protein